jgi:hypothetical protein
MRIKKYKPRGIKSCHTPAVTAPVVTAKKEKKRTGNSMAKEGTLPVEHV